MRKLVSTDYTAWTDGLEVRDHGSLNFGKMKIGGIIKVAEWF